MACKTVMPLVATFAPLLPNPQRLQHDGLQKAARMGPPHMGISTLRAGVLLMSRQLYSSSITPGRLRSLPSFGRTIARPAAGAAPLPPRPATAHRATGRAPSAPT